MKDTVMNWSSYISESFHSFWLKVVDAFPSILGAIVILIIGWLAAKLVRYLIQKSLTKIAKSKTIANYINDDNQTVFSRTIQIIAQFVYWVIILLFLVIASESLGWNVVSQEIGVLFRYIPLLFSGVIILIIGWYIARLIKNILAGSMNSFGMSGGNQISTIAFYVIMVFVGVTALNQIGVNTAILNQNITLIIACVLLSFGIAFGIASKNLVENFLSGSYAKKHLKVGLWIKVNDIEGVIEAIDNTTVKIKGKESTYILPIKNIVNTEYQIKEKEAE